MVGHNRTLPAKPRSNRARASTFARNRNTVGITWSCPTSLHFACPPAAALIRTSRPAALAMRRPNTFDAPQKPTHTHTHTPCALAFSASHECVFVQSVSRAQHCARVRQLAGLMIHFQSLPMAFGAINRTISEIASKSPHSGWFKSKYQNVSSSIPFCWNVDRAKMQSFGFHSNECAIPE